MKTAKKQQLQKRVSYMNEVVNRNKLKNSGTSIDAVIACIQKKGISICYRG